MQPDASVALLLLGLIAGATGPVAAPAGDPPGLPDLKAELVAMGEDDQRYRSELQEAMIRRSQEAPGSLPSDALMELQRKQDEIDARNLARLEEIVARHGWPGRSLVGEEGSIAAFLIVQHADLSHQRSLFPLLRKAAENGEARPADVAMLEDRILMREGRRQRYGTQVYSGPETGGRLALYPIEDEKNVDQRRAEVGLPPLDEYLEHFGIERERPAEE